MKSWISFNNFCTVVKGDECKKMDIHILTMLLASW